MVVHLAGSLGLDVLGAARPRRGAVHPLVAMPDPETGAAVGCRLAPGSRWPAIRWSPRVVDDLGGRCLRGGRRRTGRRYHAAAVIASNHLVALLGQVERVAATAGVPFEVYLDLVRATLDNVAELGPAAALTGPAARGDDATIVAATSERPGPGRACGYAAMAGWPGAWRGAPTGRRQVGPASAAGDDEAGSRGCDAARDHRRACERARRGPGRGAHASGWSPPWATCTRVTSRSCVAARAECDVVAMSIFVNPLQFGAGEDLASYPRDLDRDLALAEAAGVDLRLRSRPSTRCTPSPALTSVSVAELAATMEGASRPTHFAGVATVVAKLFNIAGPCRAYFGEKDFQQLVDRDAAWPPTCPSPSRWWAARIVREPDGLALSSRNVYLTPERAGGRAGAAPGPAGRRRRRSQRASAIRRRSSTWWPALIAAEPLAELDYVEVGRPVDACDAPTGWRRGAPAGRRPLWPARLFDNLAVLASEQD